MIKFFAAVLYIAVAIVTLPFMYALYAIHLLFAFVDMSVFYACTFVMNGVAYVGDAIIKMMEEAK